MAEPKAKPARVPPTPSQTVGPFFARDLLWKDGGVVLFPGRSDRITLTGQVFDGNGAPIFDALFETWQADASGKFPSGDDDSRPYGYGRVSTDTEGRYAIETVMPGPFRGPGGETYAPQISVAIFARGLLKALHTRVFLAPLEVVEDDPLARAIADRERLKTLIATRDASDPKLYRWDVRLRGAGEAVFIEL